MTAILYRHFAEDGALLYVGVTATMSARTAAHLSRSAWRDEIAEIHIKRFDTMAEALAAEREAVATEKPLHNIRLRRDGTGRTDRGTGIDDASPLGAWIKAHDASGPKRPMREWARHFDVSRAQLYSLAGGIRNPSLPVAMRIADRTGGAVPITAWPNIRSVIDGLAASAPPG